MSRNAQSKNLLLDILSNLLKFQFFRGVSTAWVLLFFLAKLIDISEFQVLKLMRALFYKWEVFSTYIGKLLGKIPYFPVLDDVKVNCLFLSLSFVPGVWANAVTRYELTQRFTRFMHYKRHKRRSVEKEFRVYRKFNLTIYILINFSIVVGSFMTILWFAYLTENNIEYTIGKGFIISLLTYIFIYTPLRITFTSYPNFKRGLFFALGFIISLQILYILRLPVFHVWLTEFSNTAL